MQILHVEGISVQESLVKVYDSMYKTVNTCVALQVAAMLNDQKMMRPHLLDCIKNEKLIPLLSEIARTSTPTMKNKVTVHYDYKLPLIELGSCTETQIQWDLAIIVNPSVAVEVSVPDPGTTPLFPTHGGQLASFLKTASTIA